MASIDKQWTERCRQYYYFFLIVALQLDDGHVTAQLIPELVTPLESLADT